MSGLREVVGNDDRAKSFWKHDPSVVGRALGRRGTHWRRVTRHLGARLGQGGYDEVRARLLQSLGGQGGIDARLGGPERHHGHPGKAILEPVAEPPREGSALRGKRCDTHDHRRHLLHPGDGLRQRGRRREDLEPAVLWRQLHREHLQHQLALGPVRRDAERASRRGGPDAGRTPLEVLEDVS